MVLGITSTLEWDGQSISTGNLRSDGKQFPKNRETTRSSLIQSGKILNYSHKSTVNVQYGNLWYLLDMRRREKIILTTIIA
jgi:hypothetical protein